MRVLDYVRSTGFRHTYTTATKNAKDYNFKSIKQYKKGFAKYIVFCGMGLMLGCVTQYTQGYRMGS